MVLSPNLIVQKILYGWFLAAFGDGRIVYHNNEIHFAPVHEAEVSLFDQRNDRDFKIYPRRPFQRIRPEHIEKLRAFYRNNEEWCRVHNHPCDPESFNNDIVGDPVVSGKTDSLAFIARFYNTDFWSDAERLRLEAFREMRGYLRKHPEASVPSNELLSYFYADLGRMERMNQKQKVLDLFQPEDETRKLLAAAFEAKKSAPKNESDFRNTLAQGRAYTLTTRALLTRRGTQPANTSSRKRA